jgi:hypothetical protein
VLGAAFGLGAAVLLLVAGPAPSARADGAPSDAAAAAVREPRATVRRGPHGLEVEGTFRVATSPATAWAVLTDYDGLDRFVSSMKESRVEIAPDEGILVHQEAVGGLFLVKRRVNTVLRVREEPPGVIRFEDVLRKDFEHYRGEWRLEARGDDVEVVYRLEARPTSAPPDFLARGVFERTVRRLLREVEKEIVARTAAQR